MKFENTFNSTHLKRVAFLGALFLSFLSSGQSPRPVSLSLIARFEQTLVQDLNTKIPGIQTIQIEAITASPGTNSKSENFILTANAIKSSCAQSVHTYNLGQTDGTTSSSLLLRADILPSKGNDLVTFILIKNKEGIVLFSEIYSLKGRDQLRPLPNLLLSSTASIQPNLEYTRLANQGLDTIRQNFNGSVLAFSLTGSQYSFGRNDLTFGYSLGLMYTTPINSIGSTTEVPNIVSFLTGINTELLLKEFRLFNARSNLAWNSSILTDLTQLNLGRYNFSSGLSLYVSRNLSLRTGVDLCNRTLFPWAPKPLGLSSFDRLYLGIGLGF